MTAETNYLPECGLYKTEAPLAEYPDAVPAGILIMFHNHSNRNIPFIQLPMDNQKNFWSFEEKGPGVKDDPEFIAGLIPLLQQGIYALNSPLTMSENVHPEGAVLQLGYNRAGDPILFFGSWEEGSISFPAKGYGFQDLKIFEKLTPLTAIGVVRERAQMHPEKTPKNISGLN